MDNNASKQASPTSSRLGAFHVGAFLALVVISIQSLFGITSTIVNGVTPYVAGVAMFVALLAVFGSIIATLKKLRRNSAKHVVIWDCYVAAAVIGVMGYFLAACVQTFQPGGDPAAFWTAGAVAAGTFAMLFAGGKYAAELFSAGRTSR